MPLEFVHVAEGFSDRCVVFRGHLLARFHLFKERTGQGLSLDHRDLMLKCQAANPLRHETGPFRDDRRRRHLVGIVLDRDGQFGRVRNDAFLEITATTILAYLSFYVAEHSLHLSGVMAVDAFSHESCPEGPHEMR